MATIKKLFLAFLISITAFGIGYHLMDRLGFFPSYFSLSIVIVMTAIVTVLIVVKDELSAISRQQGWNEDKKGKEFTHLSKAIPTLLICCVAVSIISIVGLIMHSNEINRANLLLSFENAVSIDISVDDEEVLQKEESQINISLMNNTITQLVLEDGSLEIQDPLMSNIAILQSKCSIPCKFIPRVSSKEKTIWSFFSDDSDMGQRVSFGGLLLAPHQELILNVPFSAINAGSYQSLVKFSITANFRVQEEIESRDFVSSELIKVTITPDE